MLTTCTGVSADALRRLPGSVVSRKNRIARLESATESELAMLEALDVSKLAGLELTGDPRVDVALCLARKKGVKGQDILDAYPSILAKIESMEQQITVWPEGGLMLVDVTAQASCPICLSFILLDVPSNPSLQMAPESGSFPDIPISVRVPGRLLMAWNSNTSLTGVSSSTDLLGWQYESTHNYQRMTIKGGRSAAPIVSTYDLSELLHPNWGTRWVSLAGIRLGDEAISRHLNAWREVVRKGYCMGAAEVSRYLQFVDEFESQVKRL